MASPKRKDSISSTVTIKILIPSFTVGAVIGKGGEVIKAMKKESGAHIRVSQNGKYYPTTNERIAFISGTNDQVHQVICEINEKIRNDKPPENKKISLDLKERKTQMKLIIPSSSAGKIIGKSGCNIKEMKEKYDVSVRIQNHEESIEGLDERIVTVKGSPENIEKSANTILLHVQEDNFGKIDNNLDYDMFNSYYYGGGYGGGYYHDYDYRNNGYHSGPPVSSYPRYHEPRGGYYNYNSGYMDQYQGGGGGARGNPRSYNSNSRYADYSPRSSRRGRS